MATGPLPATPDRPHPHVRHGGVRPSPSGVAKGTDLARRLAVAELAEGLAHDLRNQLTVVAASVQLARDGWTGGPEADLLERAYKSAMRAARLVDELLRYCAGDDADAGGTDPAEALESAVAGGWRFCAERHVRLEMRADADLPLVRGPAPAVRALFLYVLREAARRCRAEDVLIAEVLAEGRYVVLRVRGVAREAGQAGPSSEAADLEMVQTLAREVGALLDLAAPWPEVRLGVGAHGR